MGSKQLSEKTTALRQLEQSESHAVAEALAHIGPPAPRRAERRRQPSKEERASERRHPGL